MFSNICSNRNTLGAHLTKVALFQELVRRQQSGNAQKRMEKDTLSTQAPVTQRIEGGIGNATTRKFQLPEIPQRAGIKSSQKTALEERPWHSVEVKVQHAHFLK